MIIEKLLDTPETWKNCVLSSFMMDLTINLMNRFHYIYKREKISFSVL